MSEFKIRDQMGAEYARNNPDDRPDLPEGIASSPWCFYGNKGRVRVKQFEDSSMRGWKVRVLFVNPGGVVLDARSVPAERMEDFCSLHEIVFWKSTYWWVAAIKGVFVTLVYWGGRINRPGSTVEHRKGRPFALPKTEERE